VPTGTGGGPASGGTGGGGGTVVGAGGAPVTPEPVKRELLSQTGLYSDTPAGVLAEGVMPYAPQFQLWTDGAEKHRWVYIPPGEQINTAKIDEWKFPVGTKLWKEFVRDGVRVETRLLEKLPPERADEGFEGWLVLAYIWNEEQTDAVAAPDGMSDAKGTTHDVPNQEACGKCHDMRAEKPIGFSAVQLAHDGEGATLTTLAEAGLLSVPIDADLTVPGDETQRALLGYFHANCGHCHRAKAPTNSRVSSLHLWLESDHLSSFEESEPYQSLVNHATESGQGSVFGTRVVGGDPDNSELMRRVSLRSTSPEIIEMGADTGEEVPMPPLGTEVVDEVAVQMVRDWILSLPPPEPQDPVEPATP